MRRFSPPAPVISLLLPALLLAVGCAPRTGADARHAAAEARIAARFPDADTLRVDPVVPGVRHIFAWLPAGPWAVHVLEIDERVCRADVEVATPGPPITARAPTSELGADGIAAVNADFFDIPLGTPVGAHVTGGRVLVGPGTRPVYGIDAAGGHWQGLALLAGAAVVRADSAPITQVNRRASGAGRHHPPVPGLTLFDEFYGSQSPDSAGRTLRLRRLTGGAAGAGAGVVVAAVPAGMPVPLDSLHFALQAVGTSAAAWLARRAPGDTVRWSAAVRPASGRGVVGREVVGGFPLLVNDGRGVLAEQIGIIPTFGPVRHPRTVVAWNTAERRVWWLTVDGRQPPWSDGMTLEETEWLVLRLGASHALNLDGGGSAAFVLRGALQNRPTDAAGERPVGNALVLRACR